MYLIVLYFRETYFSRFLRFKNFREIKVPPKKGAAKIKDGKFSDLCENLYLKFSVCYELCARRGAQISVQRMSLFLII